MSTGSLFQVPADLEAEAQRLLDWAQSPDWAPGRRDGGKRRFHQEKSRKMVDFPRKTWWIFTRKIRGENMVDFTPKTVDFG